MSKTRSNKNTPFHEYVYGVLDNKKSFSPEIVAQCKKQVKMLDIFDFNEEEGKKCVEWIEKFCVLTEGENAGSKVKLTLWQKWIIYSIFCFYGFIEVEEFDENNQLIGMKNKYVRIVNDVLILIASGNGKTGFISMIALYVMFKNVLPAPKIYIGSNAYKQSRLCFDNVLKMISANPTLDKFAQKRASIGEIEIPRTNAKLVAMSSDGTNFEGIIPAVLFIDEIHGMKTSSYAENLRKSTKRSDALIIETTTDGTVRGGYLDKRKELASSILSGESEEEDYRKFFAIYKQESYEEIVNAYRTGNIGILTKSNPSLGIAVSVDILKGKIVDMLNDPKERATVLCKNFNIPQNPITSYFSERECRAKTFDESILYNAPLFLGLDMAYTRTPESDLACLEMLLVNPITNEEYTKDIYFLPKYCERMVKESGKVDVIKEDMIVLKSKEDTNILYNPKQLKYGYQLYADRGDVVIVDELLIEELVNEFGEQARFDCTGITEDFMIFYMAHLELKYKWTVLKMGLDPNKASKIEMVCNSTFPSIDGKYPVVKFKMEDKKNSNPIIQATKDIRARGKVFNNNKLTELHFAAARAKEDQYGNISFTNALRERKDGVIANLAARSACNVFLNNKDTGERNRKLLEEWWRAKLQEKSL